MKPSQEVIEEVHLKWLEASYEFAHTCVAAGLDPETVKNQLMIEGLQEMPLAETQEEAIKVIGMIAHSGGIRHWTE